MHFFDFVWTFACMYYRLFVVEHKFGSINSNFANFCLGQLLDGLIMLFRNAAYTLIATAVIYYGSNNLPDYLYLSMILGVTNLLVLIDCFGVSQLFDCRSRFKNLETINPELFKGV